MFKDNNRPEGLYGQEYDRVTGGKSRSSCVDRPVIALWKTPEIDELLNKLHEEILGKKYQRQSSLRWIK